MEQCSGGFKGGLVTVSPLFGGMPCGTVVNKMTTQYHGKSNSFYCSLCPFVRRDGLLGLHYYLGSPFRQESYFRIPKSRVAVRKKHLKGKSEMEQIAIKEILKGKQYKKWEKKRAAALLYYDFKKISFPKSEPSFMGRGLLR